MGNRKISPVGLRFNDNLLENSNQSIKKSDFKYLKLIVNKNYESIWVVKKKDSGQIFLMKELSKMELEKNSHLLDLLQKEFRSLIKLDNKFIVKLKLVFQDYPNIYFLFEYLEGSSLDFFLKKTFKEEETIFVFCNILMALQHMHNNNLLHLSLRPSKILFDGSGYAKIRGFKTATAIDKDSKKSEPISGIVLISDDITSYTAPEILLRQTPGYSSDFYSVGLILYQMMVGHHPFPENLKISELKNFILENQIQIKKSDLPEGWSLESADFINKLIQRKPINRLGFNGIEELKSHPWLQNYPWQKLENRIIKSPFDSKKKGQRKKISVKNKIIHKNMKSEIGKIYQDQFQDLFKEFSYKCSEI